MFGTASVTLEWLGIEIHEAHTFTNGLATIHFSLRLGLIIRDTQVGLEAVTIETITWFSIHIRRGHLVLSKGT